MGPTQIKTDIDEINAKLYAAFGSSDTRTLELGEYDSRPQYEHEDDWFDARVYYSDFPYEGRL